MNKRAPKGGTFVVVFKCPYCTETSRLEEHVYNAHVSRYVTSTRLLAVKSGRKVVGHRVELDTSEFGVLDIGTAGSDFCCEKCGALVLKVEATADAGRQLHAWLRAHGMLRRLRGSSVC